MVTFKFSLLCYIILFCLSGCDKFIKHDIVTVKVPVNVCPAPTLIERPKLPVQFINSNTSDEDVVKAYVSSIKILQNYSIKLEESLKVYDRVKGN